MPRRQWLGHTVAALAGAGGLVPTGAEAAALPEPVAEAPSGLRPLPAAVAGRAVPQPGGGWWRQWPGTAFDTCVEASVDGQAVYLRLGVGDALWRCQHHGQTLPLWHPPAPGLYRWPLGAAGVHRLRCQVVSESQAGPTAFGGFWAGPGVAPAPAVAPPARQVEFIGDSFTVGYGLASAGRVCTPAEVWATTDVSRSMAGRLAGLWQADSRVHAISGRGVVRNYGGFDGDTLPQAHPLALLDRHHPACQPALDEGWSPQLIVIGLGLNDFSTPLQPGERWAHRAALRADFEQRYVQFVQGLRQRHPQAAVWLWIAAEPASEAGEAVAAVTQRLRASGPVGLTHVTGLTLGGCDFHPDADDHAHIAAALAAAWPAG